MSEHTLLLLKRFLSKYNDTSNKVHIRYFTKSQVFIAFRAFLSRTQPDDIGMVSEHF